MTSLPVDPNAPGNSYCSVCDQSLATSRAQTHLASKKHADAVLKAADKTSPKKSAEKDTKVSKAAKLVEDTKNNVDMPAKPSPDTTPSSSPSSNNSAPKTKKAAKAAGEVIGLPRDPQNPANYWCGICSCSLNETKAAAHLTTEKHRKAVEKTLSDAMRTTRIA